MDKHKGLEGRAGNRETRKQRVFLDLGKHSGLSGAGVGVGMLRARGFLYLKSCLVSWLLWFLGVFFFRHMFLVFRLRCFKVACFFGFKITKFQRLNDPI